MWDLILSYLWEPMFWIWNNPLYAGLLLALFVASAFVLYRVMQQPPAVAMPVVRKVHTLKRLIKKVRQRLDMQGSRRRPARFVKATRRFLQSFRGPVKSVSDEIVPKSPSAAMLEEVFPTPTVTEHLPREVSLTIRSLRVFGIFDDAMFAELYRQVDTVTIPAGKPLFSIGDLDDNMYVVQSGEVAVTVDESANGGMVTPIGTFGKGESISSFLSAADVLCHRQSKFCTVTATAVTEATVARIPISALQSVIQDKPKAMRQLLQVVAVRLQRVTMTVLHRFLGLSSELIRTRCPQKSGPPPTPINFQEMQQSGGDLTSLVAKHVATVLNIKGDITGLVELETVKTGEVLIEQGELGCDLFMILSGAVAVSVSKEALDVEAPLRTAEPGAFVGELAVLSEIESFSTATATTTTTVARINHVVLNKIMNEEPEVSIKLMSFVLSLLSPIVRQVDFVLDWTLLQSGRALYRQGDSARAAFIVLGGRLRSVFTADDGTKKVSAEYGRNEVIGDMELLTGTEAQSRAQRASTVIAVRDTELAKIPAEIVEFVKARFPETLAHFMRTLGRRMLSSMSDDNESTDIHANLSTVALLPVHKNVPLTAFVGKLSEALSTIGPILHVSSSNIESLCGYRPSSSTAADEFRLVNWLSKQEEHYRIILYEADLALTRWTQCCLRQADCILVVGLGGTPPIVSPAEEQLEILASRAQKELVMLYPPDTKSPSGTMGWLNIRSWCNSHHNLRCCAAVLPPSDSGNDSPVNHPKKQPIMLTDYGRLARRLTGTSVGLVVGGGGARGMSHFGVIRAMEEAGIPIDMIGGTSIGAFVAGLYAEERSIIGTPLWNRAKEFAISMSSKLSMAYDLTYPFTAMFTGRAFNRKVYDVFKDKTIEDLWLPFFCVTTDISALTVRVHTVGVLWRYVRASMTLSGYLPPIGDPLDGHLLVDGGYLDNVPVDVMRSKGACTIIGVDVGSKEPHDLYNYGDELSGWWLMLRRLNPFRPPLKIPDMQEIASRLNYVSCNMQLNALAQRGDFEYIRPPIEGFATLQWYIAEAIEEVGYMHVKPKAEQWVADQAFPCLHNKLDKHKASISGSRNKYCTNSSSTSDWSRVHHLRPSTNTFPF